MSFTLPDDFTTPPDDPNGDPNFDPALGGPTDAGGEGGDTNFVAGLDPTAGGAPPDLPQPMDDTRRHTAGLPGSPTAGIYNDIVAAQGGVPPSGPNGTVSPTDWLYNDTVNAQGGQFPQGPNGPGAPPAAVASDLPGAAARYTPPAPSDPNAHFITRLGVDSTPTAAGAGGVNLPGSGAPGSFQQEFQNKFGFYNPEFNSQANMEQNLLKGDSVIRPQAEYMAQFDPNLKAELATINSLPDFYNSQNAADWDAAHNPQLAARVANGETSLAAARGQTVGVPAHPIDNEHALMTKTLQDTLVKNLADLGATNFTQNFDQWGNPTLEYTSANGKQQTITSSLVGYANAIDQLRQNIAAAPPPGGGGGGAPQSRYAPPRGGGGYAPPGNAPQPPQRPSINVPPQQLLDPTPGVPDVTHRPGINPTAFAP